MSHPLSLLAYTQTVRVYAAAKNTIWTRKCKAISSFSINFYYNFVYWQDYKCSTYNTVKVLPQGAILHVSQRV